MDLVIDANVLFAAFIKNSTTRRILLTKTPFPLRLYTPPFLLGEVYKYRKLLAEKTGLHEGDVAGLILELIAASNITVVNEKGLDRLADEAERISPRKNDAPYFAVALYKKCSIWSNDKPIRKQNMITVISTKELLDML